MRRKLDGQRSRHVDHPCLGDVVGRDARQDTCSEQRGQIDDGPGRPAATMRRPAACARSHTEVRLMSSTLRHSASLISSARPGCRNSGVVDQDRAAAVGSFRSPPGRRGTVPSVPHRAASPSALPAFRSISAASSSRRSALRAASTTFAPCAASTRENALPRPEEAPVTSAVSPVRSKSSAAFRISASAALPSAKWHGFAAASRLSDATLIL